MPQFITQMEVIPTLYRLSWLLERLILCEICHLPGLKLNPHNKTGRWLFKYESIIQWWKEMHCALYIKNDELRFKDKEWMLTRRYLLCLLWLYPYSHTGNSLHIWIMRTRFHQRDEKVQCQPVWSRDVYFHKCKLATLKVTLLWPFKVKEKCAVLQRPIGV